MHVPPPLAGGADLPPPEPRSAHPLNPRRSAPPPASHRALAAALRPRSPEPMTLPILVVGDVQGDHERLAEALAAFPEDEVETVFLGDFFTGGRPGGAGGHRAARIAMERRHSRAILGNHDLLVMALIEERRVGGGG